MARELASPGDEHGRTVVALFTFLNNVVDIVEVEHLDIEAAVVASRRLFNCMLPRRMQLCHRGIITTGGSNPDSICLQS